MSMQQVWDWIKEQKIKQTINVEVTPLAELNGWGVNPDTGNISHTSGRFFSIVGAEWAGKKFPIILQPEIGILGVLASTYKGTLHFLIQAKVEPGNINGMQISPTVQATRSNYLQSHGGNTPHYLSFFFDNSVSVIIDQFQSEQGRRYYKKRNRNVILETDSFVPEKEGFLWVTLGQIYELYKEDHLVNSCLRSILATIPWGVKSESRWRDVELLSYMRDKKERNSVATNIIPLNEVQDWNIINGRYARNDNSGIEVLGVSVEAGSREVSRWTQPIIRESRCGVYGVVVTKINNVPHVVLRFASEPGCWDFSEWSTTWIERDGNEGSNPDYWNDLLDKSNNSKIVIDKVFSEEGGRFYQSAFQHLVYYIPDINDKIPDDYILVSFSQILQLMLFGQYISMELRSVISCFDYEWFCE